jgi:hypothetical protein
MVGRASRRCASECCDAPNESAQGGHGLVSSKVRESQHHLSRFPWLELSEDHMYRECFHFDKYMSLLF